MKRQQKKLEEAASKMKSKLLTNWMRLERVNSMNRALNENVDSWDHNEVERWIMNDEYLYSITQRPGITSNELEQEFKAFAKNNEYLDDINYRNVDWQSIIDDAVEENVNEQKVYKCGKSTSTDDLDLVAPMRYSSTGKTLKETYERLKRGRGLITESTNTSISMILRSYIDTALWVTDDDNGEPLDRNYDVDDVEQASYKEMERDVKKFVAEVERAGLLDLYIREYDGAQFGHDFWLTRNGHGAGFWSRSYDDDELGDKLTKIAEKFGEAHVYVNDDGDLSYFNG